MEYITIVTETFIVNCIVLNIKAMFEDIIGINGDWLCAIYPALVDSIML